MALDGKKLGDDLADLVLSSDAPAFMKEKIKKQWEDIGEVIVNHILDNIEITVPSGEVIIAVSGGSGAPAVGTPNPSPISTDVA